MKRRDFVKGSAALGVAAAAGLARPDIANAARIEAPVVEHHDLRQL